MRKRLGFNNQPARNAEEEKGKTWLSFPIMNHNLISKLVTQRNEARRQGRAALAGERRGKEANVDEKHISITMTS